MKQFMTYVQLGSLLSVIFIISSCSRNEPVYKSETSAEFMMSETTALNVPPPPESPISNDNLYKPKLIKSGNLTISSDAIESTKSILYGFVKTCHGSITSEILNKNGYTTFYEIGLNIRDIDFDKFLHMLDSSGMNIVSREISVEDITLKYIDDSTRLLNKRKLENKYLDLLAKAIDMKSTLEIEDKIEEIRTEIEVKASQLKALEKKIAYSEFNVRIEMDKQNLTFASKNKFTYRIGHGIVDGWRGMKEFIIFLVTIWPVYIFAAVIVYLIRLFIKRRRKNKK